MEKRLASPSRRDASPRPSTQRQRSNSFPMVEALGCSTPEAQLLLAEGRAAVRKRRAHARRNRSTNDDNITTFNPRDHLKYLDSLPQSERTSDGPTPSDITVHHARIPSDATDRSTSTVVPYPHDDERQNCTSPTSPIGNYSANLAQFIKAQLRSIPTYQTDQDPTSPLSPRSCPDLSFPVRLPSQSSEKSSRRHLEAPKAIEIPPVRPPMRSAFSAWSSADDDEESTDDISYMQYPESSTTGNVAKVSSYTPSISGLYDSSHDTSFLLTSTPLDEEDEPDTAKASGFTYQSALPSEASEPHDDDGYPSSSLSRPLLTISSAPSHSSSSISASSYFECKRLAPQLKDRILAALTPPHPHGKIIHAISPWEGADIANVHDLFIESQQRIRVDGMSFDMARDFSFPSRVQTPC
jgi:hypothetical protein